jgi:hypothetical protein
VTEELVEIGRKRTMNYHELPESIRDEELKVFIGNYEWIRQRAMNEAEAIELLNNHPFEVEDIVYGIHGHMVHIEWDNAHWSVHQPEKFGYEKLVPYDINRKYKSSK